MKMREGSRGVNPPHEGPEEPRTPVISVSGVTIKSNGLNKPQNDEEETKIASTLRDKEQGEITGFIGVSLYDLARLNEVNLKYEGGEVKKVLEELRHVRVSLCSKDEVKVIYKDNEIILPLERLKDFYALHFALQSLEISNDMKVLNKITYMVASRINLEEAKTILELGIERGYAEVVKVLTDKRREILKNLDLGEIIKRKDTLALYLALRVLDEVIPYYIKPEKGSKGLILVFKDGVYIEGEEYIKAIANKIATEEGFVDKVTRQVLNNMMEHIKAVSILAKEIQDPKRGMFIAFKNGVLDLDEFIKTGKLELKPFNPNLYVLYKIPHELRVDVYENLSLKAKADPVEALKEIDKELYKAMCDWFDIDLDKIKEESPKLEADVEFARLIYGMLGALDEDEKKVKNKDRIIRLLLQIQGNCLLPDVLFDFLTLLYSMETMTAKSTWLRMVSTMLGWRNVASIPLQELAEDEFARIELFGKLANIYTDLPAGRIKNQGVLKQIISGEEITANVKHKGRIRFRPIAKHIYSCNKLPKIEDIKDRAYLRRILIIPFLRKFKRNEEFKKYLMRKAHKLIIPSLIALRDMYYNGLALDPVDVVDKIQEFWRLKSDPVYRFLNEMVKHGILVLDKNGVIDDNELLELYNKWAETVGESTLDMGELTKRLKKHHIRKVTRKGYGYYKGIKLQKSLDEAKKTLETFLEAES